MQATEEQLVALARRHQGQLLAIRDRTIITLDRLWAALVTDPTSLTEARFAAAAAPILNGAVSSAAAAATTYTAMYVGAATGTASIPGTFTPEAFLTPRGLLAADVLAKPIVTMRTALAAGRPFPIARDLGRQRLEQIASTDPMLAARAATSTAMQAEPRVVGYRRLPDSSACSFCLLAATQRYHVTDLMPLHTRCGCTTAPIIGTKDPGQVIDRGTLAKLKADGVIDEISLRRYIADTGDVVRTYQDTSAHWAEQARTTTDQIAETRYAKRADEWAAKADRRAAQLDRARGQLRAVQSGRLERLTAVHDHGELGPVLYPAGTHFEAL